MTFDEAIGELVEQGAIRTIRMSAVWYIAYRLRENVVEARGLHKLAQEWQLADQLPSAKPSPTGNGWFVVSRIPKWATPIDSDAAKKNMGYYTGLTRQCYTCKKERPISWFTENEGEDGVYRSWECKVCSGQRRLERQIYLRQEDEHVGDYMKARNKTSRPPVQSEL